jgi:hypothetical protein
MMTACSTAKFAQDWWRILKNGATATATTATTNTTTTTATTSDAVATSRDAARMQEQHLKMIEANAKCAELAHLFAIRVLLRP